MNVVKLYGGLGNQLFQYAFGKAMRAKGTFVRYDNSWFFMRADNPPRTYLLDKFDTHVIIGAMKKGRTLNEVPLKYKKNMDFLTMDNTDFYGYWQHPGYFASVLPALKQEFKVLKEYYTLEYIALREKIIMSESISLHVRRTDYILINGHYLLGLDYYNAALKSMPKGKVFVFSDDIPWCKANFIGDYTFVDQPDYLAFDLMRLCKHNIIANSTFSWWAAYLNNNPDKLVITPRRWRKDPNDPAMTDPDFMTPQGWKMIDSPGIIT